MIHALPPGKKRIVTRYRVGVSLLLALAAAIMYVGVSSSVDHKTETAVRDNRVVTLRPAPDQLALRQDRIFAELRSKYTGVLVVDGTEIPEDQLDHLEGLNTVGYTPGADTETGALKPGQRCAIVIFWPLTSTREASSDSFRWCWRVH